jgi:glycosyltransferase involved in cell wall biosynthesis
MNVCFIAMDYPSSQSGGGVGSQVRALARAMVHAGHQVSVVVLGKPNGSTRDVEEDDGIEIHRVFPGNLHWYAHRIPWLGQWLTLPLRELEYSWAVYKCLRRLLRQKSLDIIEATETSAFFVAHLVRQQPLVVRLHGEQYTFHKYTPGLPMTVGLRLSRILQRSALRRASFLISPSQAHAQEIKQELGGEGFSIGTILNSIDLNQTQPGIDAATDQCTVLFVGRLERRKGVPVLLAAARSVIKEHPSVQFVLAGASHPTLPQVEIDALIRDYDLESHVNQTGHLSSEDLARLYRKASVCILPSYYETFGLAALEAMAYGKPVIATQAGGLAEVVEDGKTGLLVPPDDADALARAMIELLNNPTTRTEMGKAGYERARAKFQIEDNVKATLDVYERVRAERGVSGVSTLNSGLPNVIGS